MTNSERSTIARTTALAIALVGLAAGVQAAKEDIFFTETTAAGGMTADIYVTPSNHALGMVWIDIQNDGFPDLFAVNGFGGRPNLYVNNGDGTFTKRNGLLPSIGTMLEMNGVNFADFDRDGDLDMYVHNGHELLLPEDETNANPADGPPNMLLKNLFVENGNQILPGQPLFEDVAAAAGVTGEVDPPYGTDYTARRTLTGGLFDYDRDGCVDIYAAQWVIRHGGEPSNLNQLFRNNCDGTLTFTDTTEAAGLPTAASHPDLLRATLAGIVAHFDGDVWPDIYDVNVSERQDPFPLTGDTCSDASCPDRWYDMLWRNNGDGTFTDIIRDSFGVGNDAAAGMGMDVGDLDNDGDWDFYISDVFATVNDALPLGNPIYFSNGNGTWTNNLSEQLGTQGRFSWAINFADFDQDTVEEIFVGVMTDTPQDILYYRNLDGTYTDIADTAGFSLLGDARGAALADYDRDGDLDFVVVETNSTLRLLRNDSSNLGHWLQLKLVGTDSNPDAINAIVKTKVNGVTMMRQLKGGSGTHSQGELIVHFGLGADDVADQVRVFWPSGLVETYFDMAGDTLHTLVEGQGPPVIQRVQPRRVAQGSAGVLMTVEGVNFDPAAQVSVLGGGVTITDVTIVDSGLINLTIDVAADATLGFRRIRVRNPSGLAALRPMAFEVIAP